MTQDPRQQWGPQSGPPQPGPSGYPPHPGQPTGYPPQGGYPPQPGGYGPPGAYAPGGYPSQGGYPPQGGYPLPGGYGPQGAQGGFPPHGGWGAPGPRGPAVQTPGGRKSPLMLIMIVVAAVVLLAAVGGIVMALHKDNGNQPSTSITPGQPTPPPTNPSDEPSGSPQPTDQPTSSEPTSTQGQPGGSTIDLANNVQLKPASGWSVEKSGKGAAQLSDGKNIFLGQSIQVSPSTNAGQLCTAWHKQATEGSSGGKYQDPKDANVGTSKLRAATCLAQTTVSSGQGTATIFLLSLASVRPSDGVTVIGTVYFTEKTTNDKLSKDFTAMVNSMLQSQANG